MLRKVAGLIPIGWRKRGKVPGVAGLLHDTAVATVGSPIRLYNLLPVCSIDSRIELQRYPRSNDGGECYLTQGV